MSNKTLMYIIFLVLVANVAFAEKYFVLDINYVGGSVTFNSISLKDVDRAIKYTYNTGFLIKVISLDNRKIQQLYYGMSSDKSYVIHIPYNKDAARIEVYNPSNSKIIDIEVSSFADTCGNNFCEDHESYESCTKDCSSGSKDDFCDSINDNICDPDCSAKTDADCKETIEQKNASQTITPGSSKQPSKTKSKERKEEPNYLLWSLLVTAVIVPVILFTFIRIKKEQTAINTLKQYIIENIQKGFTIQQIKNALYREGYNEKEIDKAIRSI